MIVPSHTRSRQCSKTQPRSKPSTSHVVVRATFHFMSALPISLRPDPSARREAAVTSIARACLTKARGAHDRFVKSDWPEDRTAELLTRAPTSPTTIADTAAMQVTVFHFVASLVP